MSIVSQQFWIFSVILTILYFVVPKKYQWIVLLGGNIYFYYQSGMTGLLLLTGSVFIAYLAALELEKTEDKKRKKMICSLAVIMIAGIWIVFKYTRFILNGLLRGSLNQLLNIQEIDWVLPLGISFYTFHLLGYLLDVYHKRCLAEKNYAKLFTFIAFFPHIIQGPFSRFHTLSDSLFAEHSFSCDRIGEGAARILWGLFKKLIIADKLRIATNGIIASYAEHSGLYLFLGMVLYSIELYADFSGYMDIVCGLSHIWGIEMDENFRNPYFAESIEEFWRRWHITLGAWFRDYLFYPLSMSKPALTLSKIVRKRWGSKPGKLVPALYALFFVWTATGLWHGADWSYLVWGWLNMLAIASTMCLNGFYETIKNKLHISCTGKFWTLLCILRTFILVCLFRFFSIGLSLRKSVRLIRHAVRHLFTLDTIALDTLFIGVERLQIYIVLIGILVMLMIDILQEKGRWDRTKQKCPMILKDLIYASLIILLILMTGDSSDLTGGFLYEHF